ncbi:MAG: glutaredoxin family protein [Thermomicrobiales bacterium]
MDVILLTQPQCALCAEAKELLDHLATEFPLSVATLDLNSPEGQSLAEHGGVLFPPGVFLDGEAVASGRISERKLRREIDRRLRASEYCADRPGQLARLRREIDRLLAAARKA